jgi:hypothetical protein
MKRLFLGVSAIFALAVAGGQAAHAASLLQPDPHQTPNGIGYEQLPRLTPAWSPVQVPTPVVSQTGTATTITAHPYLSGYVHRAVLGPLPAHTALELRGAARVTLPGLATGERELVINPNGHCLFARATVPARRIAVSPLRIDTPVFQLVIEPTLYR